MNKKRPGEERKTELRPKNRYNSSNFKVTDNGVFNCKNVPIGFNWLLGYCEKSSINL